MKILATISKVTLVCLAIVVSFSFLLKFSVNAGTLAAVYLYLSRIQVDQDGSTSGEEVEFVLAIDTATSISSGGTVEIEFPDAEDTYWCRTAGALAVTAVASSTADMTTTNWAIDSALPDSGSALTATCTQGSGSSSSDTITISNVGALTAGTTYGVQIQSNVGIFGTDDSAGEHEVTVTVSQGGTLDSKTFKIALIADDSVVISATVSDAPTVNCSISTTTVNLGTLYPGGAYATGSHTISTSSSGSGYYWAAYGTGDGTDAGLYKSTVTTHLIQSGTDATLDLTAVGAEGFGVTVSDPDSAGGATVPSAFSDGTVGTFGTLDDGLTGAKMILYQNGVQGSSESSTITYGARAGSSAPSGTYQETVTYVCGGYY